MDGDGDGKADPFDIDDAAASAAKYLCRAGGGDLSSEASQRNAVYSYNRSTPYVDTVMALAAVYAGGAPIDGSPAPNGTPRSLPPIAPPTLPQVSVGHRRPGRRPRRRRRLPGKPKPTTPAPTTQPSSPATDDDAAVQPGTDDATSPSAPGTPSPSGQPVAVADLHAGPERQPEPVAVLLGDEHAERDRLGRRHVGRRRPSADGRQPQRTQPAPRRRPVPDPPALPS